MTPAEITQIVLEASSLVATVVLAIVIYRLEKRRGTERQEDERHREEAKQREKEALTQAAEIFRIDNCDEMDYLPLCVIAASVNKYEKHNRAIYTRFNKCSPKLQREILRQENIPIGVTPDAEWVSDFLDKLEEDTKKYKLGKRMLYDGAKYLHPAFSRYGAETIEYPDPYIFDVPQPQLNENSLFGTASKETIRSYIDGYLDYPKDCEDTAGKPELLPYAPPWGHVYRTQDLGSCPEKTVCFWVMLLVKDSCRAFSLRKRLANDEAKQQDIFKEPSKTEEFYHCALREPPWIYVSVKPTYEDFYYHTLLTLYATYSEGSS